MTAEVRKTERLVVDNEQMKMSMKFPKVTGHWERVPFEDLKKGDIFRLRDPDGTPDLNEERKHDVCVALGDAYEAEGGVHSVESLHVNGMVP